MEKESEQVMDGAQKPNRDCATRECDREPYPLGAHLLATRCGYCHHGIYVGGGHVVHYAGLSSLFSRGPIEEVSLAQFADGRPVQVKPASNARYSAEQIVARARSRLGENCYRIASNNCEHLCEWCIAGESRSEQVETLLPRPLAVLLRLPQIEQTEAVTVRTDTYAV
jgi:hypothetical protein